MGLAMSHWISVEDRLPDLEIEVLAFHENGSISVQYMFTSMQEGEYVVWSNSEDQDESLVAYWMSLPSLHENADLEKWASFDKMEGATANSWISVSDQLPDAKEDKCVVLGFSNKTARLGYFGWVKGKIGWKHIDHPMVYFVTQPTHWMPIPEFPKESQQ